MAVLGWPGTARPGAGRDGQLVAPPRQVGQGLSQLLAGIKGNAKRIGYLCKFGVSKHWERLSRSLKARDGAAISEEPVVKVRALEDTELVLVDAA